MGRQNGHGGWSWRIPTARTRTPSHQLGRCGGTHENQPSLSGSHRGRRYDRLPGELYRGFIRSYAQSVGLDPEDTLLIYNQSRMVHDVAPPNRSACPARQAHGMNASLLWLLVAGLIVVGGVLVGSVGLLEEPNPLRVGIVPPPRDGQHAICWRATDSDRHCRIRHWLQVTIDEQACRRTWCCVPGNRPNGLGESALSSPSAMPERRISRLNGTILPSRSLPQVSSATIPSLVTCYLAHFQTQKPINLGNERRLVS